MSFDLVPNRPVGRPRKEGERYPCGKLKADAADQAPGPSLTITQGTAARRYRDTFERSLTAGHAERRVMAQQAHTAAKAALTPQQAAIAEMMLLRAQDIAAVAQKAGRTVGDLSLMLAGACDQLAAHYRAVDQAEAA